MTEFLLGAVGAFFPSLILIAQGFIALSRNAECRGPTVANATVIAGVRRDTASRHPREELVVVLVSAQAETLRLLDESEDSPLRSRKQETT